MLYKLSSQKVAQRVTLGMTWMSWTVHSHTVVTMTSKVNGKWKFRPPVDLKPIKILKPKLDRMINAANFRRNRSKVVRSPYSWNITLLWLCVIPSIPFPFLPFFLVVAITATGGRIFRIYTSNDAASPKDVPFEGFDEKKLFSVSKPHKIPKSGHG